MILEGYYIWLLSVIGYIGYIGYTTMNLTLISFELLSLIFMCFILLWN